MPRATLHTPCKIYPLTPSDAEGVRAVIPLGHVERFACSAPLVPDPFLLKLLPKCRPWLSAICP